MTRGSYQSRSGYRRQEQLLAPRSQAAQLRYVLRALRLVWAAASGWTLASTGLLVVQGLLPVVTVFLTRDLVNALVALIDSRGDAALLRPALGVILLLGGVLLAVMRRMGGR